MTLADARSVQAPALPSWAPYVAGGLALSGIGGGLVWAANHLAADAPLHEAALFVHLACFAVGFGAVLTVDWVALLWLAGRRHLPDVLHQAGNVHVPIWLGFAGLVLSGVLLEPDLSSPLTQVKLGLVLVIGWNGLFAMWLHARINENPGGFHLGVSAVTAGLSQVSWWGAMAIGFLNAR